MGIQQFCKEHKMWGAEDANCIFYAYVGRPRPSSDFWSSPDGGAGTPEGLIANRNAQVQVLTLPRGGGYKDERISQYLSMGNCFWVWIKIFWRCELKRL